MLQAAVLLVNARCKDSSPATGGQSPSDRLSIAIVGAGAYGDTHADAYLRRADCRITHVADVDSERSARLAAKIARRAGAAPKVASDMRRVLEDPTVDIVSFATPNHWHALGAAWAMDAGKHVYLEKPISHALDEGSVLVQLARARGRICQTGTQHRSDRRVAEARKFLADGKLGEVRVARCISYERERPIGERGAFDPPASVDYDLWCGPAEPRPVERKRFHRDWYAFWDYGDGSLGRSASHWLDLARTVLGFDVHPRAVYSYGVRVPSRDAGDAPNVQVATFVYDTRTIVQEVRGIGSDRRQRCRSGVIFEGSEGYLVLTPGGATVFDRKGRDHGILRGAPLNHFDNFVDVVRTKQPAALNADLREGHRSAALMHFANAAYRAGRVKSDADIIRELASGSAHDDVHDTFVRTRTDLSDHGYEAAEVPLTASGWLRIDSDREGFVDRKDADALLGRVYRRGFELPRVS